jgi:quinol monooxygenase YgiN
LVSRARQSAATLEDGCRDISWSLSGGNSLEPDSWASNQIVEFHSQQHSFQRVHGRAPNLAHHAGNHAQFALLA